MKFKERIIKGAIAGAVGTIALDAATAFDMLLRGRAPSSLPEKTVRAVLQRVPQTPASLTGQTETSTHRRNGLGTLAGYSIGISLGAAYGMLPLSSRAPSIIAGIVLGAAALAASDIPSVRLGVTDPSDWSPSEWLSDVIPHLGYGLFTAMAFETLASNTE